MTKRNQVWKICEGCVDHDAGEMFDGERHVITVPRVFLDDHKSRGLLSIHAQVSDGSGWFYPDGTPFLSLDIVKATQNTYTVRLTMQAIEDLRGDAECWSEMWHQLGDDRAYFGLGMSAKATVKRIDKWLGEQQ